MARLIFRDVKRFEQAMSKIVAESELAARAFVTEGGAIIARNAKREFTTVAVSRKTGVRGVMEKGAKMPKGYKIERRGGHLEGDQPHIRTGNLARSIQTHAAKVGAGKWQSATYPGMAYGRRVELGFRGTDSLGRRFNQPPYPYLEPGFQKALPELRELATRLWGETAS